jgi:hypothetical protein
MPGSVTEGNDARRHQPDAAMLHYYERRAEEEIERAQSASDAEAVAAHYELACRYLDLVHPEGQPPETKPEE